jgi:acyl carrier protein
MSTPSEFLLALGKIVLEPYTRLPGVACAAITGSSAEGLSDHHSDLDTTIYYDTMPPEPVIRAVREQLGAGPVMWTIGAHADGEFAEAYRLKGVECQIGHVTVAQWEKDLDADSLAVVEITLVLADEFNIQIPELEPARAEETEERQVITRARARDAAAPCEDPPPDGAVIGANGPALAGAEVDEWKMCIAGPDQSVARTDQVEKAEGGVVPRQDEVVAVVEGHVEQRVDVGAAAAPRLGRRLDHRHPPALGGEGHGGRKAGQPRPDNIDQRRRLTRRSRKPPP